MPQRRAPPHEQRGGERGAQRKGERVRFLRACFMLPGDRDAVRDGDNRDRGGVEGERREPSQLLPDRFAHHT